MLGREWFYVHSSHRRGGWRERETPNTDGHLSEGRTPLIFISPEKFIRKDGLIKWGDIWVLKTCSARPHILMNHKILLLSSPGFYTFPCMRCMQKCVCIVQTILCTGIRAQICTLLRHTRNSYICHSKDSWLQSSKLLCPSLGEGIFIPSSQSLEGNEKR